MNTLTLNVESMETVKRRFVQAFEGGFPGDAQGAFLSFPSPELLWKVLTVKRWQLLKTLAGAEPVTIRETARRVGRDVKAVHADVSVLLNAGVLDKTADGKIVFPYDAIHVDFVMKAAA